MQQNFACETSSYGAAALLPISARRDLLKAANPFRTDVCIFALLWLMSTTCMVPAALMADKLVSHLALAYCLILSSVLTGLSWNRSRSWRVYCFVCFLSAGLGYYMGHYVWNTYPTHPSGALNGRAVALCIILPHSSLVAALILGAFLPAWGYGVIGSSANFADEHGWGWEPLALEYMDFGCDWCGGSEERLTPQMFPERVAHDLLYHRTFWSGEPALDYVFHLTNDHLFLGCIFSHPISHFTKFDRIFVMVVICINVVFPVAAFTVWLAAYPLLRALLQALIVTAPRNFIKTELRKRAVQSHLVKEERDEALGSKMKRLVMRHFTKPTMMQYHDQRTATDQAEAEHSTGFFKFTVIIMTAVVCYVSYLVIHLRDEDQESWATVEIDGREESTFGILLSNTDGLVFAFVLEPLIMLFHAARAQHGPRKAGWFVGFFGQWWHERKEFGRLRPRSVFFATPRPAMEAITGAGEAITGAGSAVASAMSEGPPSFEFTASGSCDAEGERLAGVRRMSSVHDQAVGSAEAALVGLFPSSHSHSSLPRREE